MNAYAKSSLIGLSRKMIVYGSWRSKRVLAHDGSASLMLMAPFFWSDDSALYEAAVGRTLSDYVDSVGDGT